MKTTLARKNTSQENIDNFERRHIREDVHYVLVHFCCPILLRAPPIHQILKLQTSHGDPEPIILFNIPFSLGMMQVSKLK